MLFVFLEEYWTCLFLLTQVETCDHARLQIKLAFNNHFDVVRGDLEAEAQLFSVPDFIGFACSVLGMYLIIDTHTFCRE